MAQLLKLRPARLVNIKGQPYGAAGAIRHCDDGGLPVAQRSPHPVRQIKQRPAPT